MEGATGLGADEGLRIGSVLCLMSATHLPGTHRPCPQHSAPSPLPAVCCCCTTYLL